MWRYDMAKLLTRDCVSCHLFRIVEGYEMLCKWGRYSKWKRISDRKVRPACNLLRMKGVKGYDKGKRG